LVKVNPGITVETMAAERVLPVTPAEILTAAAETPETVGMMEITGIAVTAARTAMVAKEQEIKAIAVTVAGPMREKVGAMIVPAPPLMTGRMRIQTGPAGQERTDRLLNPEVEIMAKTEKKVVITGISSLWNVMTMVL
jgi:hypothetical protein